MLASETDPVQLRVGAALFVANVSGLIWLNHLKTKTTEKSHKWSWESKRLAYWCYMVVALLVGCLLDREFDTSELYMNVRTYIFGLPMSLLDFYFSDVTHVPIQSMLGAGLWCSTTMILNTWVAQTIGSDLTVIMSDFSLPSILKECLRFVVVVPFIGLLSDLIFSPMHRWLHSIKTGPLAYKNHHKKHHEYTNELTALVLFHGTFLDDFLMPATTILGGYLYLYLASLVGLEASCFSNFSIQLLLYIQIFSHAHDVRCASLVVPLPDAINFAAYHRVHHLYPSNNFGLTLPSDLIWDRILGVNTILDVTLGNEKSS